MTIGSLLFLKLQVIIFIEPSIDPTARTLQLGWKSNETIGDLTNFSLMVAAQH